jgi:hypothetical protein
LNRWSLPVSVRGSLSVNRTGRGYLFDHAGTHLASIGVEDECTGLPAAGRTTVSDGLPRQIL